MGSLTECSLISIPVTLRHSSVHIKSCSNPLFIFSFTSSLIGSLHKSLPSHFFNISFSFLLHFHFCVLLVRIASHALGADHEAPSWGASSDAHRHDGRDLLPFSFVPYTEQYPGMLGRRHFFVILLQLKCAKSAVWHWTPVRCRHWRLDKVEGALRGHRATESVCHYLQTDSLCVQYFEEVG